MYVATIDVDLIAHPADVISPLRLKVQGIQVHTELLVQLRHVVVVGSLVEIHRDRRSEVIFLGKILSVKFNSAIPRSVA